MKTTFHEHSRQVRYAALMLIGAVLGMIDCSSHAMGAKESQISSETDIALPIKYREWKLISVAHEEGELNDIRAILGNDLAFNAYREGKQPFPDGAVIARLAYKYTTSAQNNRVFGQAQSFVAGSPTNIQIMIRDSKKFATTGGWGFAQFANPKAHNSITQAAASQCFKCHTGVKDRDFVFTQYAP